jgi:small subunit ribosomal protein S16
MAVKIRLQRHGKKDRAFYHIVVADSRSPRDGAFIEKLGVYNPTTNPATIDMNFDQALSWMQKGAVPSDTCRAILSYKALTQDQAEKKFAAWLTEKEGKISGKKDNLSTESKKAAKSRLEAEAKSKEAKAAKNAAKATPAASEEAAAPSEEAAS